MEGTLEGLRTAKESWEGSREFARVEEALLDALQGKGAGKVRARKVVGFGLGSMSDESSCGAASDERKVRIRMQHALVLSLRDIFSGIAKEEDLEVEPATEN